MAGRVNVRVLCVRCRTSYVTNDEDFQARACACPMCSSDCAQEQPGELRDTDETPWNDYDFTPWKPSDDDGDDGSLA